MGSCERRLSAGDWHAALKAGGPCGIFRESQARSFTPLETGIFTDPRESSIR